MWHSYSSMLSLTFSSSITIFISSIPISYIHISPLDEMELDEMGMAWRSDHWTVC